MQKNEISPVEQPSEEKEIEKKVHTYPSSSSRGPKNWDRIAKEAEEEEKNEKYDGDQAVNRLFQQIYADSSDEVKKAMMKSFTNNRMSNQRGVPRRNAAGSLSFRFVQMARLQDSVDKKNDHSSSSKNDDNNSKSASFAAVVAKNNKHYRQMSPGLVAGYSGTGGRSATNNQRILSKNPMREDCGRNVNFDVCLPGSNHEEDAEKSASYRITNPYFANLSSTNLYIRGLEPETTDEKLQAMCERYGKIVSTKAIMDKQTNLCKGYGFVDFETAEAAERALNGLSNQSVQAQMAKQQEQDPSNLYLANLPANWTEADLGALLNKFGAVISTRVLKTVQGQSRGVGFARMDSRETCETIINMYNGKKLTPDGDPLLVKFADCGKKNRKPGGAINAAPPPTSAVGVFDDYGIQAYDLCDATGRRNAAAHFLQQMPQQMLADHHHQLAAAAAARTAVAAAGQSPLCWNYLPNVVPQTISYSQLVNNYDSAALATSLASQLGQMSLAATGAAYGPQNAYAAYQAYVQQQQQPPPNAAFQHYYPPNAAYSLPVDLVNGNRSNTYEYAASYNNNSNSNLEYQQNGD